LHASALAPDDIHIRGEYGISGSGDLPIDEETVHTLPPFGTPLLALAEHDDELLPPQLAIETAITRSIKITERLTFMTGGLPECRCQKKI
jgi:hypothetical protein